jgi:bis(5'-adenosyl)-triphosphatase
LGTSLYGQIHIHPHPHLNSHLNSHLQPSYSHSHMKALTSLRMVSTSTESENINAENEHEHEHEQLIFGTFKIFPSQIFYTSPTNLSKAIVNLKPIVPGHVLVIPKRIVAKISDLTQDEYIDLWNTTRTIQNMLEKQYKADGFNIAVQDGKAAGQSVKHVHVHILPRVTNDLERNDDIYDSLEEWAPTKELMDWKNEEKERNGGGGIDVPEDEDRKSRTQEDMEEECVLYRTLLMEEES